MKVDVGDIAWRIDDNKDYKGTSIAIVKKREGNGCWVQWFLCNKFGILKDHPAYSRSLEFMRDEIWNKHQYGFHWKLEV